MSNAGDNSLFDVVAGDSPLVISFPHSGTWLPADIAGRMTEQGREVPDTDWDLPRLYDIESIEGVTWIASRVSRYVVDLNRPPDDESLYPGQVTTGLCPTETFAGEPIYVAGQQPDAAEVERRRHTWWRPYHERLRAELDRVIATRGFAVLLDAHSIASRVPRLFDGPLPDFNFGTNHSRSCAVELEQRLETWAARCLEPYTRVLNGRFVGGHITRHYGNAEDVHAVQLELSQATYMDEDARAWSDELSRQVAVKIRQFVDVLLTWSP